MKEQLDVDFILTYQYNLKMPTQGRPQIPDPRATHIPIEEDWRWTAEIWEQHGKVLVQLRDTLAIILLRRDREAGERLTQIFGGRIRQAPGPDKKRFMWVLRKAGAWPFLTELRPFLSLKAVEQIDRAKKEEEEMEKTILPMLATPLTAAAKIPEGNREEAEQPPNVLDSGAVTGVKRGVGRPRKLTPPKIDGLGRFQDASQETILGIIELWEGGVGSVVGFDTESMTADAAAAFQAAGLRVEAVDQTVQILGRTSPQEEDGLEE